MTKRSTTQDKTCAAGGLCVYCHERTYHRQELMQARQSMRRAAFDEAMSLINSRVLEHESALPQRSEKVDAMVRGKMGECLELIRLLEIARDAESKGAESRNKLKRQSLLNRLADLAKGLDPEADHGEADQLLLDYINDPEIEDAWKKIEKWYA